MTFITGYLYPILPLSQSIVLIFFTHPSLPNLSLGFGINPSEMLAQHTRSSFVSDFGGGQGYHGHQGKRAALLGSPTPQLASGLRRRTLPALNTNSTSPMDTSLPSNLPLARSHSMTRSVRDKAVLERVSEVSEEEWERLEKVYNFHCLQQVKKQSALKALNLGDVMTAAERVQTIQVRKNRDSAHASCVKERKLSLEEEELAHIHDLRIKQIHTQYPEHRQAKRWLPLLVLAAASRGLLHHVDAARRASLVTPPRPILTTKKRLSLPRRSPEDIAKETIRAFFARCPALRMLQARRADARILRSALFQYRYAVRQHALRRYIATVKRVQRWWRRASLRTAAQLHLLQRLWTREWPSYSKTLSLPAGFLRALSDEALLHVPQRTRVRYLHKDLRRRCRVHCATISHVQTIRSEGFNSIRKGVGQGMLPVSTQLLLTSEYLPRFKVLPRLAELYDVFAEALEHCRVLRSETAALATEEVKAREAVVSLRALSFASLCTNVTALIASVTSPQRKSATTSNSNSTSWNILSGRRVVKKTRRRSSEGSV